MKIMTQTIRAHFDGKVIVPDEPVDWPAGIAVTVQPHADPIPAERATPAQKRAAFEAFVAGAHARPVPHVADEALRRDSLYED
jgi:hypothetical protein